MSSGSTPEFQSTAVELGVIADTIEQHAARVGGLAEGYLGTPRDDIADAIHEAQRQLTIAARTLRRATRVIGR